MRRSRGAAVRRPSRSRRAATVLTESGVDVDAFEWAPDGRRLAVMAPRGPNVEETAQIAFVDVATGDTRVVAGERSVDVGGRWARRRFAAVRLGCRRLVPGRSPDRRRARPDRPDQRRARAWRSVRRSRVGAAAVARRVALRPRRGPRRPPGPGRRRPRGGRGTTPRPGTPAEDAPDRHGGDRGSRINPWDGVWKSVGWLADGAWIAATGERETGPADLWLLPVPGVAADDARPRQVTDSLPAVLRDALSPSRVPPPCASSSRPATGSGSRAPLWRPNTATGKRGGTRVPTIVYPHGGPTGQSFRSFQPFKQLLIAEGFAFFDVDFRGSPGRPRPRAAPAPRRGRGRPPGVPTR